MRHGAKNVSPALLPPTFTFFDCNLAKFTFKRQPRSCHAEAPAGPASTLQRSTRALNAVWYMLSVRSEFEADPDKYTSRTETHAANVHIPPLSGLPQMRELLNNRHNYPESASPDTLTSHSRAAHAATASRHSRAAHSAWASRNAAATHSPSRESFFASAAAQP